MHDGNSVGSGPSDNALVLKFNEPMRSHPHSAHFSRPRGPLSRTQTSAKTINKLPQVELLADAIASHFDSDYYSDEYPDISGDGSELILHFVRQGWYEGRNPNAFFDTVSYLLENEDVASSGINPFFHYLTYGRAEGRKITPSISPSIRTHLLFGYQVTTWVEQLRPLVDSEFYGRQLEQDRPAGADPVAHFAFRG